MQLIAFIHDIGRAFQEHRREDFLERLKSVGNKAGKALSESEAKDIDFDEMYSHIRDNLKCIDSQEVAITGILNEEYDDWNDDSGEEFYYEDNSGISEMLEEACDFVHVCMDREKYKEGAATFDCRVVPLPNKDRVADYFVWRQEDAHRNSLNAHYYWALRKEEISQNAATMKLEGKTVAFI